ncbi:alpha/beta hydrolase [Rhodococcus sp. HNM0563]|uniref:alpha/beta fold hydrolase n=1 Tax=unclassified Rhodococcus (in: high G+C Gram-positive bacteria) TaxID=192944 RepID=UPI00146DEB73|nr:MULTISPECIES: alpha/beta hydrolase [unclassified Rhodococcus (in: high G+C Gram-positive bacteria)]MCK0090567.1 alpha/beta hydrolase [Rhodococcus sp. F64268]NLU61762.1 alpha/beta hydrolase [Rhodococcus sp. HNM0563]
MAMCMVEMDDDATLCTWTTGLRRSAPPVVLLHGGPGIPDYLQAVAQMLDDVTVVHRYDQRGTGKSRWDGPHTLTRHIADLLRLLDGWRHEQVVLVGHSYGSDLASYFTLAHPERVARLVHLAGPFTGDWREPCRATETSRRTYTQQSRFEILDAMETRSEAEEIEFLALSWFTDHADRRRAWRWALEAARVRRPINYRMNRELGVEKRADPLDSHVDVLRELVPAGSVIIGGAGDPRPAEALTRWGEHLECNVSILSDAGHFPWLEAPSRFRALLRSAVEESVLR